MYRHDTLTRSLAVIALVGIALLSSIASANDGSAPAYDYASALAAIHDAAPHAAGPFVILAYNPTVAATTVPDSDRTAPTPFTSIVLQTDTYWFDAAMRFTADPTPIASGTPSFTTALIYQTDTYWFDVAMRYADAGDPFRPQIAAER